MKRIIILLTAALLLVGCSSNAASSDEEAVTTTAVSSTAAEVTTSQTAVKATTSRATVTTDVTLSVTPAVSAAPSVTEVTDEEWNALNRLASKYGRSFTLIDRYLCWESWGKPLPEVLDVSYTLQDEDGLQFYAWGKENTDTITSDSYVFAHNREQFDSEAVGALHRLLPRGKVWIVDVRHTELPFDSPTDMSYSEFRQAFADNGGEVVAYIYVTDDIEVSEEMKEYSSRRGNGKRGELGYTFKIIVNSVSQEDYDRLEEVITAPPGEMDFKVVN